MVTYEDRIARIQSYEDIDKELLLAKQYLRRRRAEARRAMNQKAKQVCEERVQFADRTLRKLRANYFDLQDKHTA